MESHCGFLSRGKQCLMKTIPAAVWRMAERRGRREAGQSPVLSSSLGNGNEGQRKQCRERTGRNWCRREVGASGETASGKQRQDCVPLATVEMLGNDGHLHREERGTRGLFSTFNIFQYGGNAIRETVLKNHWRHNQNAGNADFRILEISL